MSESDCDHLQVRWRHYWGAFRVDVIEVPGRWLQSAGESFQCEYWSWMLL